MASADQTIIIRVSGLEKISANARRFSEKMEKSVVRRALYAGAVVFRDEARRLVPVRFGALKRSIFAFSGSPAKGVVVGTVKIDRKVFAYTTTAKGTPTLKVLGKNLAPTRRGRKVRGISGLIYPKNYAHLVEFGTRAHRIGRGSRLDIKRKGEVIGHGPQTGRPHPGAAPKPFMRPALDTQRARARAAIEAAGQRAFEEATRK